MAGYQIPFVTDMDFNSFIFITFQYSLNEFNTSFCISECLTDSQPAHSISLLKIVECPRNWYVIDVNYGIQYIISRVFNIYKSFTWTQRIANGAQWSSVLSIMYFLNELIEIYLNGILFIYKLIDTKL